MLVQICFPIDFVQKHSSVFCTDIAIMKAKLVLLQAWSGPDGSRKLRFLDISTTAQDGSMVVSLAHRPSLPPGNARGTHFSSCMNFGFKA